MNRNEFIAELEHRLQKIPEPDRQEMIYDYEEHFQVGNAEGKSEEEIAGALGPPKGIAKELLADYHINQARENQSIGNMGQAVLATIGLGVFNLIFVLGPFVGLLGVLIGLYAVGLILVVLPVLILIVGGTTAFSNHLLEMIFFSMTTIGLGVLITIGLLYLTWGVYHLVLKYLQFNLKVIRGQ